jgi:cobalamin-dependent methionine synthase I
MYDKYSHRSLEARSSLGEREKERERASERERERERENESESERERERESTQERNVAASGAWRDFAPATGETVGPKTISDN